MVPSGRNSGGDGGMEGDNTHAGGNRNGGGDDDLNRARLTPLSSEEIYVELARSTDVEPRVAATSRGKGKMHVAAGDDEDADSGRSSRSKPPLYTPRGNKTASSGTASVSQKMPETSPSLPPPKGGGGRAQWPVSAGGGGGGDGRGVPSALTQFHNKWLTPAQKDLDESMDDTIDYTMDFTMDFTQDYTAPYYNRNRDRTATDMHALPTKYTRQSMAGRAMEKRHGGGGRTAMARNPAYATGWGDESTAVILPSTRVPMAKASRASGYGDDRATTAVLPPDMNRDPDPDPNHAASSDLTSSVIKANRRLAENDAGGHVPNREEEEDGHDANNHFGRNPLKRFVSELKFLTEIINPRSRFVHRWNQIFAISCVIALVIDPIFFFLLAVEERNMCIRINYLYTKRLTVGRTLTDFIYFLHILLQFRIGYVVKTDYGGGHGKLVMDPKLICQRYLKWGFWMDILGVLPLPQVTIWLLVPEMLERGIGGQEAKDWLRFAVFIQYIPRVVRFVPLWFTMNSSTGFVFETWYALPVLYVIAFFLLCHVTGACWYLLGLQRVGKCMEQECKKEPFCHSGYLDCEHLDRETATEKQMRMQWYNNTTVASCLKGTNDVFDYGVYQKAIKYMKGDGVPGRFIYCTYYGGNLLGSVGSSLNPSPYWGEILFAMAIILFGLFMVAMVISQVQNAFEWLLSRFSDMQLRLRDIDHWATHRRMPTDFSAKILRYEHYRWLATRTIDEDTLMNHLSCDLQRQVKVDMCEDLVRRVPLFEDIDRVTLNCICERLQQRLYAKGSVILWEGEPVIAMYFIVNGMLEYRVNSVDRRFYVGAESFFGDELLGWCLLKELPGYKMKNSKSNQLPLSCRTIECTSPVVDTFALSFDDWFFICNHCPALQTKRMKQRVKCFSFPWRLWAALTIQRAWRAYMNRKKRRSRREQSRRQQQVGGSSSSLSFSR